ncbi:hypothetical protein P691DRAFT_780746 [Macrolepiota fuliginosa MF-IS2]|uniref:Secreted protein n=1 Tax=Macrolepiota fuliginosa MF-IS2 TaxID=1400762 RepID=A0A9P5XE16_9AGAR|nr:hypothetical protein P691DRAFT_780746 [Macrolepiota fuliginosa MF-IS2]
MVEWLPLVLVVLSSEVVQWCVLDTGRVSYGGAVSGFGEGSGFFQKFGESGYPGFCAHASRMWGMTAVYACEFGGPRRMGRRCARKRPHVCPGGRGSGRLVGVKGESGWRRRNSLFVGSSSRIGSTLRIRSRARLVAQGMFQATRGRSGRTYAPVVVQWSFIRSE